MSEYMKAYEDILVMYPKLAAHPLEFDRALAIRIETGQPRSPWWRKAWYKSVGTISRLMSV